MFSCCCTSSQKSRASSADSRWRKICAEYQRQRFDLPACMSPETVRVSDVVKGSTHVEAKEVKGWSSASVEYLL
jgi:hypothetical protein